MIIRSPHPFGVLQHIFCFVCLFWRTLIGDLFGVQRHSCLICIVLPHGNDSTSNGDKLLSPGETRDRQTDRGACIPACTHRHINVNIYTQYRRMASYESILPYTYVHITHGSVHL